MVVQVTTAQALIVRFKLKEVFPLSDNISLPLLRLMAATNDARHLQKLVLTLFIDAEPTTRTEEMIRNGERIYLLRMLCAHLYEAGKAFHSLDSTCKKRVDAMLMNDPEGLKLIKQIRNIYNDRSKNCLATALKHSRNLGAFHYQQKDFLDSLKEQADEGVLALVQFLGMSRFTVTDEILNKIAVDACGGSIKDFEEKVGQAISLAGLLSGAVDHLLTALFFKEHKKAILEQKNETLQVPDFRALTAQF